MIKIKRDSKGRFVKGSGSSWNKGMKRTDWISEDNEKIRRCKISQSLKKQYKEGIRVIHPNFLGNRKGIKLTEKQISNMRERLIISDGSTHIRNGYMRLKLRGKWFNEHYYIWSRDSDWGFVPQGFIIHHINGNKLDNRIENLSCIPHDVHTMVHWNYEKLNDINRFDRGD